MQQLERQNRAINDAAECRCSDRDAPTDKDIPLCKGAPAYTDDLRSVLWPAKFRPDLPPQYDGKASPAEFIQLYMRVVHAAGGNEKSMAKWFLIALQDTPRTRLMNLPPLFISSWGVTTPS